MFGKSYRPLPVFWVPRETVETVGWFLASRFPHFLDIFFMFKYPWAPWDTLVGPGGGNKNNETTGEGAGAPYPPYTRPTPP